MLTSPALYVPGERVALWATLKDGHTVPLHDTQALLTARSLPISAKYRPTPRRSSPMARRAAWNCGSHRERIGTATAHMQVRPGAGLQYHAEMALRSSTNGKANRHE